MTYQILLILTDGEIHDMARVKKLIVDSSPLPTSIIIVGIGQEEFELMVELDSDEYPELLFWYDRQTVRAISLVYIIFVQNLIFWLGNFF